MEIPSLTTEQMIEVDRLMIEVYNIQLIQMMENAGKNLAELSRRMLGDDVREKQITILSGTGNNGGGGMAAARHLHNWGAKVQHKLVGGREKAKDAPTQQLRILEAMGILDEGQIDLSTSNLIVDAMIGYGLTGNPRGAVAEWIRRVNFSGKPVLALDAPSGLNTTTGIPGDPCIRATATMTLALPKTGLMAPEAKLYVGDLYLADISVPPQLYTRLGIKIPLLFSGGTIIKL